MSIKDQLKAKAKGKLSVVDQPAEKPKTAVAVVEKGSELAALTFEIRSELDELREISDWWKEKKERAAEIQRSVIEKLIYVRDNMKKLLQNRSFEDYLNNDIGISKGYFYEQIQAYSVCAEYGKKDLFGVVDTKVLVNIARVEDAGKQKKLLDRAPSLTREYFKKSDTSDSESSSKKGSASFVAKVNRERMTIKVTDPKILKQIEALLKANGIELQYEK